MESLIIGIAGGSGSGKSTFTNRIKKRFGDDVVVLYHDNYYRRQDGIPFEQRVTVNYDHPDSLETELLVEHLKLLRQGKAIDCPVYDYSQHNRSDKILHITPSPVILVEGILLLADPRVRELLDIKVYVEADADERILRRISRDVEERGRDLNGIIKQYLNTVKPMHYLYVEPTRSKADIVINSGKNDVAFDLFVSKISMEAGETKTGLIRRISYRLRTFYRRCSMITESDEKLQETEMTEKIKTSNRSRQLLHRTHSSLTKDVCATRANTRRNSKRNIRSFSRRNTRIPFSM